MRPLGLAAMACCFLLPAVAMIEPSAFGTTPFSDEKVASPQTVPGKASRVKSSQVG